MFCESNQLKHIVFVFYCDLDGNQITFHGKLPVNSKWIANVFLTSRKAFCLSYSWRYALLFRNKLLWVFTTCTIGKWRKRKNNPAVVERLCCVYILASHSVRQLLSVFMPTAQTSKILSLHPSRLKSVSVLHADTREIQTFNFNRTHMEHLVRNKVNQAYFFRIGPMTQISGRVFLRVRVVAPAEQREVKDVQHQLKSRSKVCIVFPKEGLQASRWSVKYLPDCYKDEGGH